MGNLISLSPFAMSNFNPTKIPGCILWLDAQDLSTLTIGGSNKVSAWNDKSGQGSNATQSTGALQPTWVSGAGPNSTNVIRFANTPMAFGNTTHFFVTGRGHTALLVMKFAVISGSTHNFFCSVSNVAGPPALAYNSTLKFGFFGDAVHWGAITFNQTADTTNWHKIFYLFDGVSPTSSSSFSMNYDGTNPTVGTTSAGQGNDTVIGSYFNGSDATFSVSADFVEVIFYNSQLSSPQIAQLTTYLHGKYGI